MDWINHLSRYRHGAASANSLLLRRHDSRHPKIEWHLSPSFSATIDENVKFAALVSPAKAGVDNFLKIPNPGLPRNDEKDGFRLFTSPSISRMLRVSPFRLKYYRKLH